MKADIQVTATTRRVSFSVSRALFDELFQMERLGLCTYEEAAAVLQLSVAMIHKLVGTRVLKPVKIGTRAFIRRDDIVSLAEAGTRKRRKKLEWKTA